MQRKALVLGGLLLRKLNVQIFLYLPNILSRQTFLAFYDEATRDKVIGANQFAAHTSKTITDKGIFLEHLKAIKARGYGIDDEEKDPGVVCVAAPIFNYDDQVVAAISISGPVTRMVEPAIQGIFAPKVIEACKHISRAIGYSGSAYP